MTHPRNLIVVEDEGQASIVEEYVSSGVEAPAFSNAVTELVVGGNATVTHTMIEREHLQTFNFSTLRIEQARSANVASHSLLLGGALVRNNVHPVLAGEGGECLINGLFIGSGRQHLDNYMLVEHAVRTAPAGSFTTAFSMSTRTASFMAASSCTRTRRRPTPSRPIATCCSTTMRRLIPSRNWKSMPTT